MAMGSALRSARSAPVSSAGGAGTVLDLDQPELAIGIGGNTVVRILRAAVSVQPGISTADDDESDLLLGVDSLGEWLGDGTFTVENPSNLNSKFGKGAPVRVGSAFTADMTTTPRSGAAAADPVIDLELDGATLTTNFGDATGISDRELAIDYQPIVPPWIVGPATILVYWGGTIATVGGFARLQIVASTPDLMRQYAGY